MGVRLYSEPQLHQPDMIVGWPGIGNIGLITVDALARQLGAEELGHIEPWDFFYPSKVIIRGGVLEDMEFPDSRFYFARQEKRDLLFFLGEEQPSASGRMYAEGNDAYAIANLVLDVAEKFGCRRVYTSGAAVSITHHEVRPRVWAVATTRALLTEIRGCMNTVLMSEMEDRGDFGNITGLNGLLVGVARKRGFEGACLMGEIPDYLSRVPFPYPRASQSVLQVLGAVLDVPLDPGFLDDRCKQMDEVIDKVFGQFPAEVQEKINRRRAGLQAGQPGITDEDEAWLKAHIDDLFRSGEQGQ